MDTSDTKFLKKYQKIVRRPFLSCFLDIHQQELMQSLGNYHYFGGYADAKRKRVSNQEDFEIVCFKIAYPKKYYQLRHRDVLGALFGLGIDISLIGDIVYSKEDDLYFFANKKQTYFLKNNLLKIKDTKVDLIEVDPQKIVFMDHFLFQKIFVKSLRLDLLVASVFNISRAKAKMIVLDECVQVNSKCTSNPSKLLLKGDTISVRGYGKFKVDEVKETLKKRNLKIDVLVYS